MAELIIISLNSGRAHPIFVTEQRLREQVSAIEENPWHLWFDVGFLCLV